MATNDSAARLAALRGLMKEHNLDAYLVPSEDAHASEYLSPCDARRAFISSFTGSAGTAIITHTEAKCWTDGRYWLQAAKQLGDGWDLMKAGDKDVPTVSKWIKDSLPKTSRVGIDPTVLPISSYTPLRPAPALVGKPAPPATPTMVPVQANLIDAIWTDRPSRPNNEVFHLADEYTGQSAGDKLQAMQSKLEKIGSPGTVIAQLDEVAWLFNLRGSDIPYNPVFFAYAIVTPTSAQLFLHSAALSTEARSSLTSNKVEIHEYDDFFPTLTRWAETVASARSKVDGDAPEPPEKRQKAQTEQPGDDEEKVVKTDKVILGDKVSWAVQEVLGEDNVDVRRSLVDDAKAKKNAVEIEGFRQCHIRDGAALVRYFAWLEEELGKGAQLNEYDAATRLEQFRSENKLFKGLSFDTISSTGANAAVIHYSPPEQGSAMIDPDQIYLCDSGAQYLDGTTDTTRTLHFGQPSEEEKTAFTRVLQGHIELDTAVFPKGTTGYLLDVLARKALWASGLDYRHGTGHGVGSFLNVHEGPQGVGQRVAYNDVPLVEGHVISNEPGYYKDGHFGIRIENVQVCRKVETRWNFGDKGYLGFEHFTMVPIQTRLVLPEMLTPEQRKWLNDYHAEVQDKVMPVLRDFGDDRAAAWLEKECRSI